MLWATASSTALDLDEALDEATAGIARGLDGERPDLILAFATPHHLASDLLPRLRRRVPGGILLGCTAGGVIGGGVEVERRPAFALTGATLPGVRVTPFHAVDGGELPAAPARALLVLADPFTCDAQALASRIDQVLPGSITLGGLASGGGAPGEHALLLGDRVIEDGAVGVTLDGPIAVDALVAQGCRPVGQPMFVTRCEGNHLLEVNGRPVFAALQELYDASSEADRALLRRSLFFGIVMDEQQTEYHPGDFLVRNVLGRAPSPSGEALVVGAPLRPLQVVQFHLRDARTSADELDALLERHRRTAPAPSGALLFSCLGRGEGLYGVPGHDSDAFRRALGDIPLGGFFCNGEIGPIRGATFLHGYTSSFALFREG